MKKPPYSKTPTHMKRQAAHPVENVVLLGSWVSAGWIATIMAIFFGYVLINGAPTLGPRLIFGESNWMDVLLRGVPAWGGLYAAVVGTGTLVILTSLIAVPIGVAAGVYLACYARGRIKSSLSFAVDVLGGTPSIVMGLFGFGLITFLRATVFPDARTSLLLAAVCLTMLVLPYLISMTRISLESLPLELRLSGPAMGLTTQQNVARVLLPAARPGILSGVILAVGRAAEDTAVILLTGVVANAGLPRGLGDKFEALPFTIYYLAGEYRSADELNTAFGAALILLSLTGGLYLYARRLKRRWRNSI